MQLDLSAFGLVVRLVNACHRRLQGCGRSKCGEADLQQRGILQVFLAQKCSSYVHT